MQVMHTRAGNSSIGNQLVLTHEEGNESGTIMASVTLGEERNLFIDGFVEWELFEPSLCEVP